MSSTESRPMYDVRESVVVFFPGQGEHSFEAPRVTGTPRKSWNHGFTGATDDYVVALYYRTNGQPVAFVSVRSSSPLAKLEEVQS